MDAMAASAAHYPATAQTIPLILARGTLFILTQNIPVPVSPKALLPNFLKGCFQEGPFLVFNAIGLLRAASDFPIHADTAGRVADRADGGGLPKASLPGPQKSQVLAEIDMQLF